MPLLRYKNQGNDAPTFNAHRFNTHALSEVDVGDDSAFISDLEVFIEAKQEWKCLKQAFKNRDVIPDNYNEWFDEPRTEADRKRGYFGDDSTL